jgi:hypothetical protein
MVTFVVIIWMNGNGIFWIITFTFPPNDALVVKHGSAVGGGGGDRENGFMQS